MKIDPFVLFCPDRPVKTVEVFDSLRPELVIQMRLKAMSVVEEYFSRDRLEELVETYVTGSDQRGMVSFPGIGGHTISVSRGLCKDAALLEVMQCPEQEGDRYTAEQLIGIAATLPEAWTKLVLEAEALNDFSSKKG